MVFYEREPWFVSYCFAQTVDLLIERTKEEMQKEDISNREYQLISLTNFEEPPICTGDIDEDYNNCDYFCVILFERNNRIDTLGFQRHINKYYYNRISISDSAYVHRIIDFLGGIDEEFQNNTNQAKEIRRNRMAVWDW